MKLTRRQFLEGLALIPVVGIGASGVDASLRKLLGEGYPVATPLTEGPNYHWFGYYDKLQFDPGGRYVLGMESRFENRSPTPQDVIGVGMVDLERGNTWTTLGETRAWNWQQGCMLQWRPHSTEVLWNDREGDRFICRVLDVATGRRRTLPKPIYTLSPDGSFALGLDFARLDNMRPGYGYAGGVDPGAAVRAPESGIYRMDMDTGENHAILSLSEIADYPHRGASVASKWHYFNHLLISPDNARFVFLDRFRDFPITPEMRRERGYYDKYVRGQKTTRMYTAAVNGGDVFELDPSGKTSHFIWRDPEHVLAWTKVEDERGFWLLSDKGGPAQQVGAEVMDQNGHQTYLPGTGNAWILNDTYPNGKKRKMTLYLYHVPSSERIVLGKFRLPKAYSGEWRVDLHPRSNSDGTKVVIDSAHGGNGRQLYLIDLDEVADFPVRS